MISHALKLAPNTAQARKIEEVFWHATGAWNWLVRKVQLDAQDRVFHTAFDLNRLLKGHGPKCGLNQQTLEKLAQDVLRAWSESWQGAKGRPRLKGARNRLASVPFKQGVRLRRRERGAPIRVHIPGIGAVKFRHRGDLPEGAIKQARLCRKARGWYLVLFIDACPTLVTPTGHGEVGIDLGYETLATLADVDGRHHKIPHPREQQRLAHRLAQAQRARGQLARKIHQRLTNSRRHRNHTVSRMWVEQYQAIHISRDNLRGLLRTRGASVLAAGHGQLIEMTRTKGRQAGRVVTEPPSRNSTRRCSVCGTLSGPTGLVGLKVRQWVCGTCGVHHDRDVNAAVNARIAGAVLAHEGNREVTSETIPRSEERKPVPR